MIDDGPVQFAAGGLLRRDDGRLAVVHRPAYDDWSLPKGKPEGDETLIETAVREVQEETQCAVAIGDFAGRYSYDAGGPKVVLVWEMRLEREDPFVPNDEVDDLTWLTPAATLRRLTYAYERALVERVAHPDVRR